MSLEEYKAQIDFLQKELLSLKQELEKELENKAKISAYVHNLTEQMQSSDETSNMNMLASEIASRQKADLRLGEQVATLEKKVYEKNKDLNRLLEIVRKKEEKNSQKQINQIKKVSEHFKKTEQERLETLQKINRELKKKQILERKIIAAVEKVEEYMFVLKADIKGYSKFMIDPDLRDYIPESFERIVNVNCAECFYYHITSGDSLLILDNSIVKICKSAFRIIEDLSELRGNPQIRMAIDFGKIVYSISEDSSIKVKTGDPLRIASRIEPLVTPNQVWISEEAKNHFPESKFAAVPLNPENLTLPFLETGELNIKKKDSTEEDIFLNIYQVLPVRKNNSEKD